MGTRADFYIGRGLESQWVGSIAFDGYPDGISDGVLKATNKQEYLSRLAAFFADRDDVSLPQDGWPWPWSDSTTSDYAYALDDGKVWAHGSCWFDPAMDEPEDGELGIFPDMSTAKQRERFGKHSGVVMVERTPEGYRVT